MPQTATRITKKQAPPAREPASEITQRDLRSTQQEFISLVSQVFSDEALKKDAITVLAILYRQRYRPVISSSAPGMTRKEIDHQGLAYGVECAQEAYERLKTGGCRSTRRMIQAGLQRQLSPSNRSLLKDQPNSLAGCTLDERSYFIRLVRVLRDNYWMSEFLRQLLDKDAEGGANWTIKQVKALLDNFDTIEALASNAQRLGQDWSNHPILRAIRKEWGEEEIAQYQGDRRVEALIQSAHGTGGRK